MRIRIQTVWFASISAWLILVGRSDGAASKIFDIPMLDGIEIDGAVDDWAQEGFHIDVLTTPDGGALPTDDFDPRFTVAWDERGLLVLAIVDDDVGSEHDDDSQLWRMDCVEVFIAEAVGHSNRHQLVVSSGADQTFGTVRGRIYDHRPNELRDVELTARFASRVLGSRSFIEMLLPWTNLAIQPLPGTVLGLQFAANDDDSEGQDNSSLRVVWFPSYEAYRDPTQMHGVRLSRHAGEPVLYNIRREIGVDSCVISLLGAPALRGKTVTVEDSTRITAHGSLADSNGRVRCDLRLPRLGTSSWWPSMRVRIDTTLVSTFPATKRLEAILDDFILAMGGRERMLQIESRHCLGRYEEHLSYLPQDRSHPIETYSLIPDSWLMLLEEESNRREEGFDGSMAWVLEPDELFSIDRGHLSVLSWILNPQFPLRIGELFPDLTLQSTITRGGRIVHVVRATSSSADYELNFDDATGLLSRIGQWDIERYETVDDVAVVSRISVSRKGGWSAYAFHRVEHDVPVDESRFTMPDRGVVFPEIFSGIDDERVLPLLKNLPFEHGGMNVPCRDGRFLYDLILKNNYRRGLEIGTSNGYSTLWIGLAFRETGGEIVTMEIDSECGAEALRNFKRAGLDASIDLVIGDAIKEIPGLTGSFDFVFIDAWKPDYITYFELLRERIQPGGAITAHNVSSQGNHMEPFLEALRSDSSFATTMHHTSREGISVSIRCP